MIAAMCVIMGSSGLGYYYCIQLKNRRNQLQYFLKILTMIQNEIRYTRVTFPESCQNVARRVKEPYRTFLQNIYERSYAYTGEDLGIIWCSELKRLFEELALQKEECEFLEEVIDGQGFLDSSMQIQKITFQMEQIADKVHVLRSREENKSRIYLYLGMMGGILCTILFL